MTPRRPALENLLLVARALGHAAVGLARGIFFLCLRLPARARVASALATLVVLSAMSGRVSASVGAAFQRLAVLLLALVGLGIIVRAPFRRRRW